MQKPRTVWGGTGNVSLWPDVEIASDATHTEDGQHGGSDTEIMTMAMHTKHIMLDHVDQIVEYCGVWRGPQERVSVTIRRGTADSATGHPDVSHS
jgi:hypothetical protein